jgi:SH3-like domain-containing protein
MGPRKVIAEKGTDTVKLVCSTGEKLSVTAFGTISAEGEKLPLWVVTKDKTKRCLNKFGDQTDVIFRYSESGWATENLVIEYLEWLSKHANGELSMLIMDVFPTHRTSRVKEKAMELAIELRYVPAGGTSKFQPLDARIFGELKMRASTEFKREEASKGVRGVSYSKSIRILLSCWEKITT